MASCPIEETAVNRSSPVSCRIAALAALLALSTAAVQAQTLPAKQPRQLPPPVSQTNSVPAGVDIGTGANSDSVPLGTPVMTGGPINRATFKAQSAAARAAGRPKPAASAASAAKPGPAVSASDVAASRPARPPRPSPPAR
jgi:hypothetical protein